jgi:hypothetical protein
MPRIARLLAPACLLVSWFSPAQAVRAPGSFSAQSPPIEWRVAADPARQAALAAAPEWQVFRAQHGAWRAWWNETAGTPHLASGPSIPIVDRASGGPAVDRALRTFVARNPTLFGATPARDLQTTRVQQAGSVWYASYRRLVRGLPVLFEDWEFRVSAEGRLMAFGADAVPIPRDLPTGPTVDAQAAREAARADLGLAAEAGMEGGEELSWLPAENGGVPTFHLVREVRARTQAPPHHWVVLVDAVDGTVRWRHDRVRFDITGGATGQIHDLLPSDPTQARAFAHQGVTVGSATTFTDAAGNYSTPATGTVSVSSELSGAFCDIIRNDGPNAAFSTSIQDPGVADIAWDDLNSQPSERDAYFHVNRIHDHLQVLDPGFVGNDYPMPVVVNANAFCDAFWDGTGITFFSAGQGCPNTATIPDVVYHEYGHAVNDNLYEQSGVPSGMFNGALHEGLADANAAFFQDDPIMGNGFFGPGTFLRTLVNTRRWPDNRDNDPHLTGLILGAALWDLRQSVGLATAERLSHFAKYGHADDFNDGVAMGEYFVAVLVADDDDGNLANGTPHASQIIAAFNAHGIGTGLFLNVSHTPLPDSPSGGPFPLTATITYSGPIGGLDPSSFKVRYSINDDTQGSRTLVLQGSNQYGASIPAPINSLVRYHLEVADQFGGTPSVPPNSAASPSIFLAGATTNLLVHNQETNANWSAAAPGDNATGGRWIRANPQGSTYQGQQVQPEDDHTPTGILCFVTANNPFDQSPFSHDVDNGHTTLTTSLFDGTSAGPDAMIEYYRWYTNNLGPAAGQDVWRVDLSADGGFTWTPVENTTAGTNAWRRVVFFIRQFATPTSTMQVRFIAEDVGFESLIEAAVDDFRLFRFNGTVTDVSPAPAKLDFALPAPNPSADRTRLAFSLTVRGPVDLSVFDLAGRRVRGLSSGVFDAGPHEILWDGRGEDGRLVPSGLYFARLVAEGQAITRRIARSR